MSIQKTLLISAYCIFLYPISYFGLGDGISINYSFLLFPLISLFFFKSSQKINLENKIHILIYSSIFLLSILDFKFNNNILIRSLLSFLAFMSMFAMLYVDKFYRDISALKLALIIISFLLSSIAIYKFYYYCNFRVCDGVKSLVGSQRYGFLYLMAIWILVFSNTDNIQRILLNLILISIVTIGLVLTFSRSSLIGLALSMLVFFTKKKRFEKKFYHLANLCCYLNSISVSFYLWSW